MAIHRYKRANVMYSVWVAIRGIGFAIRSERNMKIHVGAAILAVGLGIYFGISTLEWLFLTFTLTLVLAAECINTAIEVTVDMSTKRYRLRAMLSKDVAAGAVLITAVQAIITGGIIFGPRLCIFSKGWVRIFGY